MAKKRSGRRLGVGKKFSNGAKLLWAAIESAESLSAVARDLGTAPNVLCRWLYGDRRPTYPFAAKIRDQFGVQPDEWFEPAKGKFETPALKQAKSALRAQARAAA